jgi:amidase
MLILVIPISSHQDSVGALARSVTDAAIILSVIAGRDPLDNFTLAQPIPVPDYRKALNPHALHGVRLGVPRKFQGSDENIIAAFNASLEVIRKLGAVVIDPAEFPDADELITSGWYTYNESIVLSTDFKVSHYDVQLQRIATESCHLQQIELNKYIAGLVKVPTGVKNLADIISFDIAHASEELIPPFYTDQSQ